MNIGVDGTFFCKVIFEDVLNTEANVFRNSVLHKNYEWKSLTLEWNQTLHKFKLVQIIPRIYRRIFWTAEWGISNASDTRQAFVLFYMLEDLSSSNWSASFATASTEAGFLPLPEGTFNDLVSWNLTKINRRFLTVKGSFPINIQNFCCHFGKTILLTNLNLVNVSTF